MNSIGLLAAYTYAHGNSFTFCEYVVAANVFIAYFAAMMIWSEAYLRPRRTMQRLRNWMW